MHTHQSRYTLWSWIVALILALLLLWMLLTGRGPSAGCCDASQNSTTGAEVLPTAFSFTAKADAFVSQGDSSSVSWLGQAEALTAWLANGNNLQLSGDATQVTLTGTVDNATEKDAKAAELQKLVGVGVIITNNLTVPPSAIVTPVLPEVAKLYFETGKSELPAEATTTLEPTIEWLISHPESKAVISGYHDARGNRESNQKLAKARAQSSMDTLVAAGIETSRIEMRKPIETEGSGNEGEARRVEIAIE